MSFVFRCLVVNDIPGRRVSYTRCTVSAWLLCYKGFGNDGVEAEFTDTSGDFVCRFCPQEKREKWSGESLTRVFAKHAVIGFSYGNYHHILQEVCITESLANQLLHGVELI